MTLGSQKAISGPLQDLLGAATILPPLCIVLSASMNEGDPVDDAAPGPATLPRDVQARWDTPIRQVASATDDAEGFQAASNAMRQAGSGIDLQQILNAIHVPKNAGEHTDALRGMLARIPDGWGRWISCECGWYPLLVELDEQLQTLLPNYKLHQVKEKFGGLRYYWTAGEHIHDPDDPEPPMPARGCSEAESKQWSQVHEAWCERLDAYRQRPEVQPRSADLEQRVELAKQLVHTAEARAAVTCELCGEAGRLHHTPTGWYKTLCLACAEREGYVLDEA
jgi:hypothetical protein